MSNESRHISTLPQGHVVNDYRILSVLGHGGFGITYLAEDIELNTRVAIKEYLPDKIAFRDHELNVRAKSSDEDEFRQGIERFLYEVQTLRGVKHPNIIGVRKHFAAHGTAYIVFDYLEGESLSDHLRRNPQMSEVEIRRLLFPLLDGLEALHNARTLHRDIKPENIYLCRNGTPVLLDFGAARTMPLRRSQNQTKLYSLGYSPAEQYATDTEQGPWTDIYAIAATLYRIITGQPPAEASRRWVADVRKKRDPMPPIAQVAAGKYSPGFLSAIDWALAFAPEKRPRSIGEWRVALCSCRSGVASNRPDAATD